MSGDVQKLDVSAKSLVEEQVEIKDLVVEDLLVFVSGSGAKVLSSQLYRSWREASNKTIFLGNLALPCAVSRMAFGSKLSIRKQVILWQLVLWMRKIKYLTNSSLPSKAGHPDDEFDVSISESGSVITGTYLKSSISKHRI